MLTYLVVISSQGRRLPDGAVEAVTRSVTPKLSHDPERAFAWSSRGRNVAAVAWETGADLFGGSHIFATESSFTAFSGWAWPTGRSWSAGRSWGRQLHEFLQGRSAGPACSMLSGTFSLVRIDDDRGWIGSDPVGTGLVYVAEADDFLAVSNRADVAAHAVSEGTPVRDVDAMAWLPFFGFMLDDRTSYTAVRVLPTGSFVRMDDRGWEITDPPDPWADISSPGLADVDLDRMADALIEEVRTSVRLPLPPPRVDLSGGKDSRLILAAVSAAGLRDQVQLRTFGLLGSADVEVARRLAGLLGMDLDVEIPETVSLSADGFDERLRRHVHQTSGMFGAWDLKGEVPRQEHLRITGLFGGVARTPYRPRGPMEDAGHVRRYLSEDLDFDAAGVLQREVRERCSDRILEWGEEQLDRGCRPQDVPLRFYLEFRLRRWVGAAQEVNARYAYAYPLSFRAGIEAGWAVGDRVRRTDRFHFELIRRLDERLAREPLADHVWDPDVYTALPERELYASLEPVRSRKGGGLWQDQRWAEIRPVFETELIHRHTGMEEVLDREGTASAIEGYQRMSRQATVCLWGALGAAVWTSRGEDRLAWPRFDAQPEALAGGPAQVPVTIRTDPAEGVRTGGEHPTADPLLGSDWDGELAGFCDDLLACCDATVLDRPIDLDERLRELAGRPGLARHADRLVEDRGGVLGDVRALITLAFWSERFVVAAQPPEMESVAVNRDDRGLLGAEDVLALVLDAAEAVEPRSAVPPWLLTRTMVRSELRSLAAQAEQHRRALMVETGREVRGALESAVREEQDGTEGQAAGLEVELARVSGELERLRSRKIVRIALAIVALFRPLIQWIRRSR